MELQDFVKNVANQFENTDLADITSSTEFKNLDEWSSLTSLSLIAMCDEEYGVNLKGDDIRVANTVEELFNIIKSRKE